MNTECRKAYHVPTLIQQTTDALLPIHKKAPILPKGRELNLAIPPNVYRQLTLPASSSTSAYYKTADYAGYTLAR